MKKTLFLIIPILLILFASNANAQEKCNSDNIECIDKAIPVSSEFGERWGSFHTGTDYGLRCGTEIFSAAAGSRLPAFGRVIEVGNLLRISSGGQAAG